VDIKNDPVCHHVSNNFEAVYNSFNMAKKFVIILTMALVHFGLSILVVATSMSVATAVSPVRPEPSPIFRLLVMATRVLHFPIISLSFYSRRWFPGNLIYVPIFINSLLWATGIYLLFLLAKKIIESDKNGKGNR
jgi:hypothetical protein